MWFQQNKLSLNLSKSKIIIFGNGKTNVQGTVQIEGVDIERVLEIKFLGVMTESLGNFILSTSLQKYLEASQLLKKQSMF